MVISPIMILTYIINNNLFFQFSSIIISEDIEVSFNLKISNPLWISVSVSCFLALNQFCLKMPVSLLSTNEWLTACRKWMFLSLNTNLNLTFWFIIVHSPTCLIGWKISITIGPILSSSSNMNFLVMNLIHSPNWILVWKWIRLHVWIRFFNPFSGSSSLN